jgi:hypothetical protein
MQMTPKKKTASITLSELSERYLQHLESEGRSRGTVFSYSMELNVAQRELGADLSIGAITRADVERYNASDRVMKLKSGKPKAAPSYLKTQRVLRLALAWAADTKLIETSPAEAIEAAEKPTKRARKQIGAYKREAAGLPPVLARKPRARKQAIVLEVAQPEAEAAADVAESMIAANPESAA